MSYYKNVYLREMGFDKSDFIPCEVCGKTAVDIHHIKARGMGGSKYRDDIENLIALCRPCHITYGDKKHHMAFLREIVQNRKK